MKPKRLTPAFSMLELIFVIAILGIVASIGAEMIAKVYDGYIVQRAEHKATTKTELAATQIANRLASAIPGTVYRVRTNTTLEAIDSDFPSGVVGTDYKGIQWVGSDTDSFAATTPPGWSGFIDVDDPANAPTTLSTPGSDLGTTSTIINNLSASTPAPKIYFPYDLNEYNASSISGTTISLSGSGASHIVEHYKLAWTSYALVVENDGHLYLYYDFPAIPATNMNSATSSRLLTNVNTFKFKGEGRTIRFKICKEEQIGDSHSISACKEKAVF